MKSLYSVQITENSSISIPMIGSLTPEQAILLGALIAKNNSHIVKLVETRGSILLGCLIGSLLKGEDVDLEADESVALTKMLVSDIVSLIFEAFETLEKSMGDAGVGEDVDLGPQEAIEPYEAVEPAGDDN